MTKRFLNLLLLCSIAFVAFAQTTIDLAGEWQFKMDPDDVGIAEKWYSKSFDETITLPASMPEALKGNDISVDTKWVGSLYDSSYFFNPYMKKYRQPGKDMKLQFFLTPQKHYVGVAWYRKTVHIDEKETLPMYTLLLERPHITTDVWVNGEKVQDTHNSLSVPHKYYLYGYLKAGDNDIVIRVNNDPETVKVGQDSHSVTDQTQGCWNGLVGKLQLQKFSNVDCVRVYPDIDSKTARVHLELSGMQKTEKATVRLYAVAFNCDEDKKHQVSSKSVVLNLKDVESTAADITLNMGDSMLLWDEFHPQLYSLEAEITTKSLGTVRSKLTQFGMRKIEIRDKMFYINGRQIQLRGTVENCDFPNTGYPPTDVDSWMKLFKTCKSYGLNHMRFHSYCPPEAAFVAADMTGFYIQPEGPSWPNHGVKLGRGEPIDKYLMDESIAILDEYGNHPSFTFYAFGNEPAGNWVKWSTDHVALLKEYDNRHLYCGFSVGGGWAWQPGSEYAVKAGARGLNEWARTAPESVVNFEKNISMYNGKDMPNTPITMPFVSHETGQWCAFPNFDEIEKYTGVNRAGNFEIFRDLLKDNGMEKRGHDFMMASGKLQALCYKAEVERTLRTPNYAGFQLLSLNDYSGQGTALVGVTDVFFDNKGYISNDEFREFCSPIVPLAKIKKFTYKSSETFTADIEINQFSDKDLKNVSPHWVVYKEPRKQGDIMLLNMEAPYAFGDLPACDIPVGGNFNAGSISLPLDRINKPTKLTLAITIPGTDALNHWDFWVYPEVSDNAMIEGTKKAAVKTKAGKRAGTWFDGDVYVTDSLDAQAQKILDKGGKVLVLAAGKVTYGKEVVQQFTPVFWNTSWFKMRPPHTTGIFVENGHSIFELFPTDCHSDMQWWELVNRAQVMQFTDFPQDFQPLVQSIDTWFVSRKIGMLFEAKVGKGRLVMTTMDLTRNLDSRIVARQMKESILHYMHSDKFHPEWTLDKQLISDLFTKVAGDVNMFTKDSPDELKPSIDNSIKPKK